jgi:hypothetical protein
MVIGRDLREPNTHIETAVGVHGLASTSSVVGTQDSQTLYNKTLISPILTGTTENDAGISFQGTTVDSYTTTLNVVDPTANRTITFPNTSGTVSIIDAVQTLTNKTITSPTINGSPVITGLSSAGMSASSAAPKDYVDSILGSATAASTSAASAAVSATSSATSASAALTSANSAATSATASAASAATATTQATAATTSATSAAASATAAATSANSASTSASSALTSQSAAATSASSAATSATSAAASVSSIAGYATTASNSASAAATSANSAATSATSAAASAASVAGSTSAAAISASSSATSATAAATSAASAAASATAAATSATSAGASATAASTSASSAQTSQTAAAASASSAATSQSAAATSAASAATSATSAATSATSAATTYTAYDQRYLGSKSSAPTVDNLGNALITGSTYWNSSTNAMYVWSGSAWVQTASTTAYSAPTLGTTVIASGTTVGTITGLTLSGGLTTADPTTALGVANKQYVDSVTAAINFHTPVVAASVTNLGVTYNNGTSGVGATLTADTLRAFNTLDGTSVSVGQRVLIKDQTAQLQNGIYTLTNNGVAGTTAWILTRATDNDQTPEIANGDIIFTTGGTVNSGKTFVNSTTGTITIGTTAITFATYYTGLPAQTSNSGKYLTTDGTTPSWAAIVTDPLPQIMMLMGA